MPVPEPLDPPGMYFERLDLRPSIEDVFMDPSPEDTFIDLAPVVDDTPVMEEIPDMDPLDIYEGDIVWGGTRTRVDYSE